MLADFKDIQPCTNKNILTGLSIYFYSVLTEGGNNFLQDIKTGSSLKALSAGVILQKIKLYWTWPGSVCLTSIPVNPLSKNVAQMSSKFKCISEQRQINNRWRLMCCKKNSMSLIIFNDSNSIELKQKWRSNTQNIDACYGLLERTQKHNF